MIKLDQIDLQIVRMLQQDSRQTIKEIANALKMSTTPVFNRIKRLEHQGVIERYTAIVNPEKLGKKLYAFIQVSLKEHNKSMVKEMMDKLIDMPEILECHYVTGGADLMLKVLVNDMEAYNFFITEKIFGVSNIARIESLLSLSARKQSYAVPID